jgi:hypothetical protein
MSEIGLELARDGLMYTARISIPDRNSPIMHSRVSFREAMEHAAVALRKYPNATLEVRMHGSLSPSWLPKGFEDELRNNFDKAMDLLHPPARVVKVRDRPKTISISLRSGYGTLADALGESIYISRDQDRVESPLTGRWENNQHLNGLGLTIVNQVWATVDATRLLGVKAGRFWLPRRWNPSQGWICREDFSKLFNTYKEEKDRCLTGTSKP